MGAPKGTIPPNAGKGRKPGQRNKVTKSLKDAILAALANAGGEQYLTALACENPSTFAGLLARVLPLQVKADATDPQVPLAKRIVHQHFPAVIPADRPADLDYPNAVPSPVEPTAAAPVEGIVTPFPRPATPLPLRRRP
jgi:hypothetical protein